MAGGGVCCVCGVCVVWYGGVCVVWYGGVCVVCAWCVRGVVCVSRDLMRIYWNEYQLLRFCCLILR